jgi:osmotically-inducible protein OsmY
MALLGFRLIDGKGRAATGVNMTTWKFSLYRRDRALCRLFATLILLIFGSIGLSGCATPVDSGTPGAANDEASVDDNVVNLAVNKKLIDDGVGDLKDVTALVHRQRVLLIGTVEQEKSRGQAGKLAGEVENVLAVMNEIQVTEENGIGTFISDVLIEKEIQSGYLFDDEIESANFRVRVVNGTVYILGHAKQRAEFDRAMALANQTDDVKKVVNYVVIDLP